MRLEKIVCSGVNEYTDIKEMAKLYSDYHNIEFGIQVSGRKSSYDSARWLWLQDLSKHAYQNPLPLALHLNQDWVNGFCFNELPEELEDLLIYRNKNGEPIFYRVQLNFKIGRDKTPYPPVLECTMQRYPQHRFILSYNPSNLVFINQFYSETNVDFDCLFDDSFGEGILPSTRNAPVFVNAFQGYTGGLTPENVCQELDKISRVVPTNTTFFIDAEGGLKGNDGRISLDKCRRFIENALFWEQQHQ